MLLTSLKLENSNSHLLQITLALPLNDDKLGVALSNVNVCVVPDVAPDTLTNLYIKLFVFVLIVGPLILFYITLKFNRYCHFHYFLVYQ